MITTDRPHVPNTPSEDDALSTFIEAYPRPTPADTQSWQYLFPEHADAIARCARILGMYAETHPLPPVVIDLIMLDPASATLH